MDVLDARVTLTFVDGAGVEQRLDFLWDLYAPPEFSDPASVARKLAELHALPPRTERALALSASEQLHAHVLAQLEARGVSPSTMHDAHAVSLRTAQAVAAMAATRESKDAVDALITRNREAVDRRIGQIAYQLRRGAGGDADGGRPAAGEIRRYQKKDKRPLAMRSNTGPTMDVDESAGASDEGSTMEADDGNLEFCETCQEAGELICCDRCPISYHITCLRKPPPDNDDEWLCPECVRTFGAHREFERSTSGPVCTKFFDGPFRANFSESKDAREELIALTKLLSAHEFAEVFNKPVNIKQLGRAYTDIVKRPMDYSTVAARLADGFYGSGSAFDPSRAAADIRLVPHNARIFNRPGSTIWRMADVLFRITETVLRDRVRLTPEQQARLLAMRREEAPEQPLWISAHAPTAKRHMRGVELIESD